MTEATTVVVRCCLSFVLKLELSTYQIRSFNKECAGIEVGHYPLYKTNSN